MDIMHDFLEGALQYEIKLFLHHVTTTGILSLDDLKYAIQSFDYGFADASNKPSVIYNLSLQNNNLLKLR